jgi:phosphoserine phosphatase
VSASRDDILHRMLEVARRLSATSDLEDILRVIIDAMRDSLDAERATVFEFLAASSELVTSVAHGVGGPAGNHPGASVGAPAGGATPSEIRIPITAGLAGECARLRRIINVPDAYADPRFNKEVDRRTGFHTRSILTIPLIDEEGLLVGVTQVLNKRGRPFDRQDEALAEILAAQAAVAMKRGRLIQDRIIREKLERDLQLARRIQQSTLPEKLPVLRGFDIAAWSEPAEQTGGDTYDVIGFNSQAAEVLVVEDDTSAARATLLMADATGHGIGAALSVTQVRAMLRIAVRMGAPLRAIAEHLNRQLCHDLPSGRFVTAWLGELNVDSRTLLSISAGQAPLIRYGAAEDRVELLDSDTMPLGLVPDLDAAPPRSLAMQPGDIFAAISDGIFEAFNDRHETFGTQRTVEILRAGRHLHAQPLLDSLRRAVAEFTGPRPADDDRTAIIIRRS